LISLFHVTDINQRSFADKKPDGPLPSTIPKLPPSPEELKTVTPNPASVIPPTGTGSASVAPPVTPKKKSGRFRRFVTNLLIASILTYGLGIYYALTSDNFHDFFTEYVPFGEDVIAYFEEREFKSRMSSSKPVQEPRLHPQVRGEAKVTVPSRAGVSANTIDASDLAVKGRHSSAIEPAPPKKEDSAPHPQTANAQTTNREVAVAPAKAPKPASSSESSTPKVSASSEPAPAPKPAKLIDNINIENATEPVVQDLVKILNDLITVINADNASDKYASSIDKAKGDLSKIVADVSTIREKEKKETEEKITTLHSEFDTAARQLLQRTEQEMKDMEIRWMEEFESERNKVIQAYEDRLKEELASANSVSDQKLKNELLKQAIALQQDFSENVKTSVESEREGRLSKLDQLSTSVSELEKLTGEWNSVVESTLSTQHLLVAVEAVKALLESTDRPKPFVAELAALKEVAAENTIVNAAIASINPSAYQKGISTSAQLIDRFRRVSTEVRKASLLPENAGIASLAASLVLSKVMFKKDGLPLGDDVESVLTRTEALLEEGNLEDAVREMNGLSGWAKVLSRDWLAESRRALEVQQALDVSCQHYFYLWTN
jgi:mitofilin